MRLRNPGKLDRFAASPAGDVQEFEAAFAAVKAAYPNIDLGYIGTDGVRHYFLRKGDPITYAVPVTKGWKS